MNPLSPAILKAISEVATSIVEAAGLKVTEDHFDKAHVIEHKLQALIKAVLEATKTESQ